ncbi:methyltransferase family protein [Desulfatibacillum aliphaticivorans]|uniref:methyltransferase family protein n=1 Tax=Desulfatibacillum aliphaticivorans TaxID=218208 RepID=UPI0004203AD7|nr:hypothetical protein [Desulfatibacillum aliphaticivorans]
MRSIVFGGLTAWGVLAFHLPQMWLMFFLLFPKTGPGTWRDAVFNALIFAAWGLIHSILARDFSHRIMAKLVGEDFVKLLYVSIAGLTQCALIFLWRPLEGVFWQADGVWRGVLIAAFLAAAGAVWVTSILLDYMEALGVRAVIRRWKRQEVPPPVLSMKGPYAHCRHPVYFFTLFFLWIGPVMNATRLEFALLGTIYVLAGMRLEDRDTAIILGEEYREYQKHVPILIPRLKPWRREKGDPAARV